MVPGSCRPIILPRERRDLKQFLERGELPILHNPKRQRGPSWQASLADASGYEDTVTLLC